jgi:hypothetical protein
MTSVAQSWVSVEQKLLRPVGTAETRLKIAFCGINSMHSPQKAVSFQGMTLVAPQMAENRAGL